MESAAARSPAAAASWVSGVKGEAYGAQAYEACRPLGQERQGYFCHTRGQAWSRQP
jgi:hypothetical protein